MASSRNISPTRLPFRVTGRIAVPPGARIRSMEVMGFNAQSSVAARASTAKAERSTERKRIRFMGLGSFLDSLLQYTDVLETKPFSLRMPIVTWANVEANH